MVSQLSLLGRTGGGDAVAVFVHRVLFPAALRLESECPLNSLSLQDGEDVNLSIIAGKSICLSGLDSPRSPLLLAASLGVAMSSTPEQQIRIVDRPLLSSLRHVYGDSTEMNVCNASASAICTVMVSRLPRIVKALVACADMEIDGAADNVGADSWTAGGEAETFLLELLHNCSDMLLLISNQCVSAAASGAGQGGLSSTTSRALVNEVMKAVSNVTNDVSASISPANVDGCESLVEHQVVSGEVEGEKESSSVDTAAVVKQKRLDKRVQGDQQKKKVLYRIGRTMKVLRSALEGQRSSKAD